MQFAKCSVTYIPNGYFQEICDVKKMTKTQKYYLDKITTAITFAKAAFNNFICRDSTICNNYFRAR